MSLAGLPMLVLVDEVTPVLGTFGAVATNLLIFVAVSLIGFALSFMPFTSLVNNVFPWLGWLGILFILVLLGSWVMSGRTDITDQTSEIDLRDLGEGEIGEYFTSLQHSAHDDRPSSGGSHAAGEDDADSQR